MSQLLEQIRKHPVKSKKELRSFGLVLGGLFLALTVLLWWRNAVETTLIATSSIGGALVLLGLVAPMTLKVPDFLWNALGMVLGHIVGTVAMILLFFGAITPLGTIMRLLGKHPLKAVPIRESYWQPIEVDGPASRPNKPY